MTRTKFYKIAGIVMAALVLFIFGYYLLTFESDEIQTEKVGQITVSDTVTAKGFFIRDEETVSYSDVGFLVYETQSGKRIESGGVVATVYASERDVSRHISEEIIKSRIEILDKAISGATYSTSEINDIEIKLSKLYCEAAALTARGKAAAAKAITEEINYLLCRKQMLMATDEERIAVKESLETELEAVVTALPISTVKTEKSGYFVSAADGYEALLSLESADELTPEYLDSIEKYAPGKSENWIGKLVTNYKWCFAVVLTSEQAAGIEKGAKVSVLFPFSLSKPLSMLVSNVIKGNDGRVTAVLSSDVVSGELLSLRTQTAAITKTTVNGLKIDSRAIKMVDGEIGVYAIRNGVLEFLPIQIVSANDEYYVAKWNDNDDKTVMLYDEIVVSGRDLHDGKLIR